MSIVCPKCHGQMRQYERSSVTVDQCTECRGIFLDRGELERLIDAENAWHGGGARPAPPATQPPPQPGSRPYQGYEQPAPGRRPYRDYDSDEYPMYGKGDGHGYGKKRKRRGFLEELFD